MYEDMDKIVLWMAMTDTGPESSSSLNKPG